MKTPYCNLNKKDGSKDCMKLSPKSKDAAQQSVVHTCGGTLLCKYLTFYDMADSDGNFLNTPL